MEPFLIGLKERGFYTQTELLNFLALQSKYSKRLYEYLRSYINAYPSTQYTKITQEFNIDELREMLAAKDRLLRYADFKRKAIDLSVRQINNVTDIEILEVTEKRLGRTISSLTFHFGLKDALNRFLVQSKANKVIDE